MKKAYTLTFIFSRDKKYVLLIYKNDGPIRHQLNGVGGKIESNEYDYKLSALREVYEETGERILIDRIFPYKIITTRNGHILHIFYAFIDKPSLRDKFDKGYQSDEGEIKWYDVSECIHRKIDKLELLVPFLIKGIIKKEEENENKKLLETPQDDYKT